MMVETVSYFDCCLCAVCGYQYYIRHLTTTLIFYLSHAPHITQLLSYVVLDIAVSSIYMNIHENKFLYIHLIGIFVWAVLESLRLMTLF